MLEKHLEAFTQIVEDVKKNKTEKKNSLLVVYPNGDFIHEKKIVDTMVELIKREGIENVKKLNLTGREGRLNTPCVPFISDTEYFDDPDKKNRTQRLVDGYYVFKKYSAGEVALKLLAISNGLHLHLHIEEY